MLTLTKNKILAVVITISLLIGSGVIVFDALQDARYKRQTQALSLKVTKLEAQAETLQQQAESLQTQLKTETERRITAESELALAHNQTEAKRRNNEKIRRTDPIPVGLDDASLLTAAEALGIRP